MNRTVYMFPGQGSQFVGMGRELFDASAEARDVFATADQALGFSISSLCFEGPEDELRLTANTQPAILTVSVAAYRALKAAGAAAPDYVAGHSLGEYSALVAAGVLEFETAVRIVRDRGRFMQDAVPDGVGAMAAILGAEREAIERACAEAAEGEVCQPANFNSPGQIVIAGNKGAVDRAGALAKQYGAKRVVPLEVSAPFHSALMKPAADRLRPILNDAKFADPEFPVIANVSAAPVRTGDEAREALAEQVASPVLWEQSLRTLLVLGVKRFVEIGPGRVLTGLVKKVDRGVEAVSVGNPNEICAALAPSEATGAAEA